MIKNNWYAKENQVIIIFNWFAAVMTVIQKFSKKEPVCLLECFIIPEDKLVLLIYGGFFSNKKKSHIFLFNRLKKKTSLTFHKFGLANWQGLFLGQLTGEQDSWPSHFKHGQVWHNLHQHSYLVLINIMRTNQLGQTLKFYIQDIVRLGP